MKRILFFLTVSGCVACNTKPTTSDVQPSTAISVLFDVTDPRTYWPSADHVLKLYRCDQTPSATCLFRLGVITDRRLNAVISYRLGDTKTMERANTSNDPQFRGKTILYFYESVRKAFGEFYETNDTTRSLDNSECFRAIASELSFLAETSYDRRFLIVASDLMEKSDLWDSYTSGANPKDIANEIEKANLLPKDLTGIQVIFLFNPKDRMEDQNFSILAEAYTILLTQRGALVKIQANL